MYQLILFMKLLADCRNNGLFIYGMNTLNDFCKRRAGKRVFVFIEEMPEEMTERQKYYYLKGIVPEIQKGFAENGQIMGLEETERKIRELMPVCHVEELDQKGKGYIRVKEFEELGKQDMIILIDECKRLAAEEFSIFINDPRTI